MHLMLNSWFVFLVLISSIQNPRPDSDVCDFPTHQEGEYGWTPEIEILPYCINNVWTNSRELSKPFAPLLTCWGVSLRDEAHVFSVFLTIQGKSTTFRPWPLCKIEQMVRQFQDKTISTITAIVSGRHMRASEGL